jgi:hypothetical protein
VTIFDSFLPQSRRSRLALDGISANFKPRSLANATANNHNNHPLTESKKMDHELLDREKWALLNDYTSRLVGLASTRLGI